MPREQGVHSQPECVRFVGVRLIDLSGWAFGARTIVELAQGASNRLAHEHTSGAHMAHVLLQMQPVRRLIDPALLIEVDAGVDRALMITPKSAGKKALLTLALERVLTNDAGDKTTVTLVRSAITGIKTMVDAEAQLQAQAEAIATLLDAPRLMSVMSSPSNDIATKGPFVSSALIIASQAGHDALTTRHVIAAVVKTMKGMFAKRGLAGFGDTERLDTLLAAIPRRDGKVLMYTPRLVGAIAAAIAAIDEKLGLQLSIECFDGDSALDEVRATFVQAQQRIAAAVAAEKAAKAAAETPSATE